MPRLFSGVIAPVCACAALAVFSSASGEFPGRVIEPDAAPVDAPMTASDLAPELARALLSNIATPEALAASAAVRSRGGVIQCYDITVSFGEDPVSGLSAVMRVRGTDQDFDGEIRSDAGGYAIYPGVDEVEQCSFTVLRHGVAETVASSVVDGAFVNSPYFYFRWSIGSGTLHSWDTGASEGVFLVGGPDLGAAPDGTYVNTNTNEVVNFPFHTVVSAPCACDPGACDANSVELEVEPDCGLPTDTVNGGCNSTPFVATPIALGQKVCGTAGTADDARDTDWYELVLPTSTPIRLRGRAGFDLFIAVAPADICTTFQVLGFASAAPCAEGEVNLTLAAGTYYLFAAPDFGADVPCGTRYQLSVVRRCPGDVTGDGRTNTLDFNVLAGNFAHAVPPHTGGDIDGNGFVNALDFNIMAGNFACLPF